MIGVAGRHLLGLLALGLGDGGFGTSKQSRLVALHGQHIVALALDDGLGGVAPAMQRIHRHDAALQAKQLDQLQRAGRLVVARRQRVGQRHARLGAPRRHHHRRHVALAVLVGATQRLAVERHHAIDLHRVGEPLREATEHFLERLRIEQAEHPAEGVVARDPVLQLQDGSQQPFLLAPEQRDVGAVLGPAQHRQQSDEHHLRQIVIARPTARVDEFRKAFRKPFQKPLRSTREAP